MSAAELAWHLGVFGVGMLLVIFGIRVGLAWARRHKPRLKGKKVVRFPSASTRRWRHVQRRLRQVGKFRREHPVRGHPNPHRRQPPGSGPQSTA